MKFWCLLCLIVCIDCRSLKRNWLRRYGGPNPKLYHPTTSLHAPRPGSYAHQWPLHGGPRYHYPVRPHTSAYQQPPPPPGTLLHQQKIKILNIVQDHSGHVDADSLFPAAHHIPTVFIPSNAPALAPPMVVGYGLYDKRPEAAPPHAHFSMLHPSYESGFTQHHHNEISYFDNPPPPPQNYKYPMPYPVRNYVASGSYSSVAHQGQNVHLHRPPHFQQPPAAYLPEPPPSSDPLPSPSHHPVPEVSLLYPPPQEVGYLHPSPAHFSHNNPLGTSPCCDGVPWTPVVESTPLLREHRLHPTTRHPMIAYLPVKGHHVESESRPYISVVTIGNATTTSGHRSNDTVTEATTTTMKTTTSTTTTTKGATKDNVASKPTSTSILMLSSPVPTASPTRSSLPKLRNTTSFLGAFLASITEAPGMDSGKPVNLSQADVHQQQQQPTTTAAAPPTPSGVTTSGVTTPSPTPSPPIRARPVRPTQSDDIFGIPGDILPSEGNEAGAAADSAGGAEGGGMVDIFTSFLDELANIIEQFSPTDLPGVANEVGGAVSDAAGESANAASEVGGAAGEVGGALGDAGGANLGGITDAAGGIGEGLIGGGVPESVGGGLDGVGGVAEGIGGGLDGAGGVAEGFGGGLDGAGGVAEGIGGGVAPAGNEISASSQISSNTASNSPLRQQSSVVFDGFPFGGPQFGANFNNFESGESAEAEGGGFFDDSMSAVSHAESEPVAESSMGIQDHFIEIPISELVPHPSFLRNNFAVHPFAEAEPHPVITNLGRPKDFEVDHFDSEETGAEDDHIASATESNYRVNEQLLDSNVQHQRGKSSSNDQQEDSLSTAPPVSNHLQLTKTTTKYKSNAIPWPKVPRHPTHFLNALLAEATEHVATETPEIISFSSTVSHWPQYGSRVTIGGRSNEKKDKDKEVQREVEVLSSAVSQDKSGRREDDHEKKPTAKTPVIDSNTPKTDITIKSELGTVRNNNGLSSFGHTEKSIAVPEISTIRDYHSRNTDEEEDNVPDAEGIPANILPEVQSNINLDLLRTEYSEGRMV